MTLCGWTQVANTIAAFEDKTLVRYNGDYKFYMDSNAKLAAKVLGLNPNPNPER